MQYLRAIITTILAVATLISASPLSKRDQHYGVSIAMIISNGTVPPTEQVAVYAPTELNKLTAFTTEDGLVYTSKLILQNHVSGGVNPYSIQCRGYTDTVGTQPVGEALPAERPTVLSIKTVRVGSLLCYVAGEL
jgi:hypothetical protein